MFHPHLGTATCSADFLYKTQEDRLLARDKKTVFYKALLVCGKLVILGIFPSLSLAFLGTTAATPRKIEYLHKHTPLIYC